MLTNKFATIATLALAFGAGVASAEIPKTPGNIKVAVMPADFKKSPINLAHNFDKMTEATIVSACTYDRHIATVVGDVYIDKTEAKNGKAPVQNFRIELQNTYAKALTRYNSNELEQDDFMPGTFKDFGSVFSDASRAVKEKNKVTLVFIPSSSTVGEFTETCPPVLKR